MKNFFKKYTTIFYSIILFVLLATLSYCSDEKKSPVENNVLNDSLAIEGYQLLWNDEFNGDKIDQTKWTYEVNGQGGGNNELQYYTDRSENSYIENGSLVIEARQEEFTGADGKRFYTSARLTTKESKSFMYGRVTAKIKLPYGQGIWPAFWMLGLNIDQVGWPKCGEIDIMELIGGGSNRDNMIYGTLHWDANGHASQGGNKKLSSGIFADDFHEFTVEWSAEKIDWYLDNMLYYSLNITNETMSEFQQHFFIILNLAVGGNWPGNPDTSTLFPQKMIIDYVRVYHKE